MLTDNAAARLDCVSVSRQGRLRPTASRSAGRKSIKKRPPSQFSIEKGTRAMSFKLLHVLPWYHPACLSISLQADQRDAPALGTPCLPHCSAGEKTTCSGSCAAWEPSTSPTCPACFIAQGFLQGAAREAVLSAPSLPALHHVPDRCRSLHSYFFGRRGSACILL